MAKRDDKSESETRMKVVQGRKQDSEGNWGCCIDVRDRVYCPWLIHKHLFCNEGCTWEADEEASTPYLEVHP